MWVMQAICVEGKLICFMTHTTHASADANTKLNIVIFMLFVLSICVSIKSLELVHGKLHMQIFEALLHMKKWEFNKFFWYCTFSVLSIHIIKYWTRLEFSKNELSDCHFIIKSEMYTRMNWHRVHVNNLCVVGI